MGLMQAAESALFEVDAQGRTLFFPKGDLWLQEKTSYGTMWERQGYILESDEQRLAVLRAWRLRWGVDLLARGLVPVVCFTVPGSFWSSCLAALALTLAASQALNFWEPLRRLDFLREEARANALLTPAEMLLWREKHGHIPSESLGWGLVLVAAAAAHPATTFWWEMARLAAAGAGAVFALRMPTFLWVPRPYRLACQLVGGACVSAVLFLTRA